MPPTPTARPRRRAARAAPAAAAGAQRTARRDNTAAALDGVRRVVRALRLAAGGAEAAAGLSAAQLFVLQVVHAAPGASLGEVAERTLTDRTSVAAVVERLVARGLVERRRAAADRRRVELAATAAGAALLGRAPHPPTRRLLDGLAALDDTELRGLARGLTRLAHAMGLDAEPAALLFDDADAAGADAAGANHPPAPRP